MTSKRHAIACGGPRIHEGTGLSKGPDASDRPGVSEGYNRSCLPTNRLREWLAARIASPTRRPTIAVPNATRPCAEPHARAHQERRARLLVGIQCLLGVLLFFLIDGAIFRSGWYFRRVAPLSSLGQMAIAIDDIRHIPTGKHAVLVIGDSRAGEGFSMPTADRAASAMDLAYVFYNAAVAGTTPRVWYYLLRQIDNPGERLAAVAVMVTSYHDDEPEDLAERPSDIAFVHPLLTLTDLTDFPGFAHKLYPSGDPRAICLLAVMRNIPEMSTTVADIDKFVAAIEVAHGLRPKNDFAMAALEIAYGLPADTARTIFLISRLVGWLAHVIEQYGSRSLIRPRASYVELHSDGLT